jgi:hypothetical protein
MLWEKQHRRRRRSSAGLPWWAIATVILVGVAVVGLVLAIFIATGPD